MIAALHAEELTALLKDFYLLTKIKIVVFDADGEEVIACPDSHCAYCALFQQDKRLGIKCRENNRQSFERCRKTGSLTLYHCHAGLIEAAAPLLENGIVIGYLMFGQITDTPDDAALEALVRRTLEENRLSPAVSVAELLHIERKTTEQIQAAAKIMEACTSYMLFKKMMSLRRQNFADNLNRWLCAHLEEDLTAGKIAAEFGISRSKLYQSCDKYLGMGIAQYIKQLRLARARKLLQSTRLPVSRIAAMSGFPDYNYFCRIFKKEVGVPARKYRNQNGSE